MQQYAFSTKTLCKFRKNIHLRKIKTHTYCLYFDISTLYLYVTVFHWKNHSGKNHRDEFNCAKEAKDIPQWCYFVTYNWLEVGNIVAIG
jgi:hypothetical protein